MTRISHSSWILAFVSGLLALSGTIHTSKAEPQFVTVGLQSAVNNRFAWIPIDKPGIKSLGGVPFDLMSSNGKNVWDSALGTSLGVRRTQTLDLSVTIQGASNVYTLINTRWGVPDSETVSLSFLCSDGLKHSVALKSGENIRDWSNVGYVDTVNERLTQNVMPNWKKGRIDRQQFELPKSFASRTL